MQIAVGVFALLIFLIISASYINKKHYYIKPVDGAIEIWQGKFAPKGTSLLVSLPGKKLDAPAKEVYSRQEAYPLIYSYFKDKATTLMEVKGMPDFETVKFYLEQALCYTTTAKEKADVNASISSIDFMVLMSKADAAMSKKTVTSFETALQHLDQAAKLDLEDFQEEQIKRKTALAKKSLQELKQKEAAAKEAAAEAKKAQITAPKAQSAKLKADAQKDDAKKKDVKAENAH
jgi:colicin import membrane protein